MSGSLRQSHLGIFMIPAVTPRDRSSKATMSSRRELDEQRRPRDEKTQTLVQALADVITVRTTPADFIVANHELITGPRNSQHVSLDSNIIIA
ncbi:hypothetical protein F2Q69_00021860 [Brassica cretica]|uniref:Uncharacterized protein n=1 Tax=Brassica cretica TaxID=69181 RepID=A0A8S9QND8_BRACR|nr:hypothetical protein F2Q69_00021860 [Brassica cretica]